MAAALMKLAHSILRDAEVRLCELVPKALAARRDDEASRLMDLARLLADARCSRAASQSPARQCREAAPAGPGSPRGPRPLRKRKAKTRTKASPYPKFLREGNALLKLGWSRKSRTEYEHRAPREAVLAVAERIAEVASRQDRFTVEDLGEVRVAPGDEPISGCQVYLCIAWLRRAGLLVQHGRRGYSLPVAPAEFPAKVESSWNELPGR